MNNYDNDLPHMYAICQNTLAAVAYILKAPVV
jgi:hypothetical protein